MHTVGADNNVCLQSITTLEYHASLTVFIVFPVLDDIDSRTKVHADLSRIFQ